MTRIRNFVIGVVAIVALVTVIAVYGKFDKPQHTITLRVDWHIATPSDVWYLINKDTHSVPEAEWESLNGTVKRDFPWDSKTLYGIGVRMDHPDPEPYWFSCDIELDGKPFANLHAHYKLTNKPGDLFCTTV